MTHVTSLALNICLTLFLCNVKLLNTVRDVEVIIRHRLSSISPGIRPLEYRGYRGISCTTLRPGTTLSTATRRISWTEPIMRRDVTTISTGIRRKSDKGAVSGRSVSHQCVGLYQYTKTLGYGDSQLPRACRCVKKKI